MSLDTYRAFISELTEASSKVIKPYFGLPDLKVDSKSDASPVTEADRGAEKIMREMIEKKFPTHGIIGEEFGTVGADSEFVWVLDPVDGTISFSHGCPLFGTLIGLLRDGKPVLGAIHQPLLNQLCVGDGSSTELNGRPCLMRSTPELAKATLCSTDLTHIEQKKNYTKFDALRRQCRLFRGWGDCYGYLLAATGWIDIMIDPIMNPWDILPLIPVIRGAGGVITTWEGGDPVSGKSCVVANKSLHPLVIEALN
jgi:histidinol phosphatase-like enzyme (inositol monophosphatase family)